MVDNRLLVHLTSLSKSRIVGDVLTIKAESRRYFGDARLKDWHGARDSDHLRAAMAPTLHMVIVVLIDGTKIIGQAGPNGEVRMCAKREVFGQ